jgi:general secretion pathway protein B
MSFILDALKKSENDRQRQSGPALFEVRVAPPRSKLPMLAIVIVSLLVVNLGVVGWIMLRKPAAAAVPAVATPAATPAPASAPQSAAAQAQPSAQNSPPPERLALRLSPLNKALRRPLNRITVSRRATPSSRITRRTLSSIRSSQACSSSQTCPSRATTARR